MKLLICDDTSGMYRYLPKQQQQQQQQKTQTKTLLLFAERKSIVLVSLFGDWVK